jgi:hypothetical protein
VGWNGGHGDKLVFDLVRPPESVEFELVAMTPVKGSPRVPPERIVIGRCTLPLADKV